MIDYICYMSEITVLALFVYWELIFSLTKTLNNENAMKGKENTCLD